VSSSDPANPEVDVDKEEPDHCHSVGQLQPNPLLLFSNIPRRRRMKHRARVMEMDEALQG
jgi:hypothetical protein